MACPRETVEKFSDVALIHIRYRRTRGDSFYSPLLSLPSKRGISIANDHYAVRFLPAGVSFTHTSSFTCIPHGIRTRFTPLSVIMRMPDITHIQLLWRNDRLIRTCRAINKGKPTRIIESIKNGWIASTR